MQLSPYGKMVLGAVIVAFGIVILTDFSLWKALVYITAVLVSALLFL